MFLREALPAFHAELEQLIDQKGSPEILAQLHDAEFLYCTLEPADELVHIYVKAGRELNIVETNLIKPKREEAIELSDKRGIYMHIDNFGRIVGFQVLYSRDVCSACFDLINRARKAGGWEKLH